MKNIKINHWDNSGYVIRPIDGEQPDDLFISCISYEPRTLGVLKKLSGDYKCETAFFIVNEKSKYVENNIKSMRSISDDLVFSKETVMNRYSIDNPIKIILDIDKIIKSIESKKFNVTLDMTTFPRSQLLTLLYYIRHHPKVDILRIFYTTPIKYGKWLTRGHKYSSIPPFFEGPLFFEKKIGLIILTGFEYDRTISLIEDVEPAQLLLCVPNPGISDEFKYIGNKIIKKLDHTMSINKEILNVPGNNPFLCRDCLRRIIDRSSRSYDFFIAPIGSKLMVLGAYLTYEENPNFRIIYPRALAYNVVEYSQGCRDIYEILLKK